MERNAVGVFYTLLKPGLDLDDTQEVLQFHVFSECHIR